MSRLFTEYFEGDGPESEFPPEAVLEDVIDEYVSIERAETDYGAVIQAVDPDRCEYTIDRRATEQQRDRIRRNRSGWLDEAPDAIAERYRDGELDELDLIRRYGVIVDWATGELLERTTDQFRSMVRERAASAWEQ